MAETVAKFGTLSACKAAINGIQESNGFPRLFEKAGPDVPSRPPEPPKLRRTTGPASRKPPNQEPLSIRIVQFAFEVEQLEKYAAELERQLV